MGKDLPPEAFESSLDHRLTPAQRAARALKRRTFREMVKNQIEDHPLGWLQRRALLRFAARIPLDDFEARLIIRAVEYECGHVAPAAMADIEPVVAEEYLHAEDGHTATTPGVAPIISLVLLLLFLCLWLFG
jgi:hypothetical protein